MQAVTIENLSKQYGNCPPALNGLSLTVEEGEIFSLLGKNGAGKSTLIRILTTCLKPTSGHASLLGRDVCREVTAIRAKIACASQQISVDTHLSLQENMLFQSQLYKIPRQDAQERMKTLIGCFELEPWLRMPVSSFSGGIKRRLDIALSLTSNPKILFLDEPTVGMDVQSRIAMWNMIRRIRDQLGTTVFLTTHYLEEADQLSDTVCIIKEGKEMIQGSPDTLKQTLGPTLEDVFLRLTGESEKEDSLCLS